ncbi:MAG: DUF2182 domain-containing protein, partial [Chloroflexi bacterium]|nr:DUF2182 domain-containing protein [Chloroflexota bacterium]
MLAGLASLVVLAWVYLLHLTQQMPEMGLGITMSETQSGQTAELAWTLVMWAVMMAAMMLPSAWPVVLAFVAINRRPRPLALAAVFLGGYLAVWIGFSALATLVHWLLHSQALLSPMLAIASAPVGGVILLAAGLFQWSSLKHACLAHCRSPLGFFLTDWREGVRGAFLMGLRYGGYCLGCCGLLMALLFVTGVMNLLWTAVMAVFILVEKVIPA